MRFLEISTPVVVETASAGAVGLPSGARSISVADVRGSIEALIAGVLCVLLAGQPVLAAGPVPRRGPTANSNQIQNDERVLHALNRLTFGPRPGDVAAVEAIGLNKWFEMQLDPARIDDSALEAKLQMFPAMQLSQADLFERYPGQQQIRAMAERDVPLPADPVERAIYADQIGFYKMQQAKQAAAKQAAPASDNAMAGADGAAMTSSAGAKKNKAAAGSGSDMAAAGGDMSGAGGEMAASGGEMAAADVASGGDASSVLPKAALAEPGAPSQHVDALFADLEAMKILNLPPDQRMQRILAMPAKQLIGFRQSLSGPELQDLMQGLNPQQREILAALQNSTRMVGAEELQARMMRDVYSDRQLEAVMTDFWLNHFNVYIRKNQNEPYLIPSFERDVIRPNALGRFENLLVATAKSPAMLMYLDNWQSIGANSEAAKRGPKLAAYAKNPQVQAALKDRGLNENYGRELMELHTLGVGGGYSQTDVTQVAKVFTGWTMEQPGRGGLYMFDDRRHEPGPKTVLGKTIPEGGEKEGLEVLHMLATSPATAKFISNKLAIRFVSDTPPPALVDRMAQAFLDSGGDIKTVLRTMFNSPEFWSPAVLKAKVKTPEEFVISAARASGATVNNAQGLVQALDKLGMPFYGMQTPNGYSWLSEPWVSTGALVTRMNFALVLSGDRLGGARTDWAKLLGESVALGKPVAMAMPSGGSPASVDPAVAAREKRLEILLLGGPVSDRTRATVLSQSNDSTAALQAANEFQGGRGGGAFAGVGLPYDPAVAAPDTPGGGPGGARAQGRPGIPDDRQAAIMAGLLLGSPEFQRR
jgi:uncharacterized protein (DUF1800 family)